MKFTAPDYKYWPQRHIRFVIKSRWRFETKHSFFIFTARQACWLIELQLNHNVLHTNDLWLPSRKINKYFQEILVPYFHHKFQENQANSWPRSTNHELLHATDGESSNDCSRSLKLTCCTEIICWLKLEWTRMDKPTKMERELEIMRIIIDHSFNSSFVRHSCNFPMTSSRDITVLSILQLHLRLIYKNNINLILVKVVMCWIQWFSRTSATNV